MKNRKLLLILFMLFLLVFLNNLSFASTKRKKPVQKADNQLEAHDLENQLFYRSPSLIEKLSIQFLRSTVAEKSLELLRVMDDLSKIYTSSNSTTFQRAQLEAQE